MKKNTIATGLYSSASPMNWLPMKSTGLLYLIFLILPFTLFSQNLDDFRTAASSNGVNLIPFPDLRKDATSIADDVQRRKDETKSYDYDLLASQKNNMLKEIKKDNDDIASITKEIEDFKSKHPDGSTSSFDGEIDKKKKDISGYNDKIKDMNDKLGKAVEVYDRLYNARAGLREYFQKALDQLSDVKSNPDKYLGSSPTDDDRKKLQEYVKVIEDQIQSNMQTHKDQEEGAKKRKADFENLIKTTEYRN
jgi:chromosome segregation ATPase